MSDLSSSDTGKPGSPKKRVSPARNLIGLVVLLAVLAVGWLEYSAKSKYNAAVKALEARSQDEEQGLLTVQVECEPDRCQQCPMCQTPRLAEPVKPERQIPCPGRSTEAH